VWGTSADPNTWFEQNCTLKNAPMRQLRRQEREIEDNERGLQPAERSDSDSDKGQGRDDDEGEESKEDRAGASDKFEYKIEGLPTDIKKIEDELNRYRLNP
jgi:hypothetical protein